jgi:hypothetical protein
MVGLLWVVTPCKVAGRDINVSEKPAWRRYVAPKCLPAKSTCSQNIETDIVTSAVSTSNLTRITPVLCKPEWVSLEHTPASAPWGPPPEWTRRLRGGNIHPRSTWSRKQFPLLLLAYRSKYVLRNCSPFCSRKMNNNFKTTIESLVIKIKVHPNTDPKSSAQLYYLYF